MENKLIGIISYLPDDIEVRTNRVGKLLTLLKTCNEIFNLPILIVAQNYKESEINLLKQYNNIKLELSKDKLGIVGARNKLRQCFLNSEFEYLIMLDDDSKITGNKSNGNLYKKQLDENPNKYYVFNKSRLKLFAISKSVFKFVDFDFNCQPELEQGFEDRLFYNTLLKRYPDKKFNFNVPGLEENSLATSDVNSTWYKNQNNKSMLDKTFDMIDKIQLN